MSHEDITKFTVIYLHTSSKANTSSMWGFIFSSVYKSNICFNPDFSSSGWLCICLKWNPQTVLLSLSSCKGLKVAPWNHCIREKTIFSEIIMIKLSIILEIKENQYQYLSNCACTHPSLDQTLTLTYYQFQYCCWVRGGKGRHVVAQMLTLTHRCITIQQNKSKEGLHLVCKVILNQWVPVIKSIIRLCNL